MTQPQSATHEVLAGYVERVTYHNGENGFCVQRAKARGHRDVVTVVGHAATISAGEWITASGEWVNDRTHGQQFRARFLRTSPPTSADGIEKYLSSGMIRGIGPAYAKKLVRSFGEKVFDVIEASPERLREVDGIGPIRAARILSAWAEHANGIFEILQLLESLLSKSTLRLVEKPNEWRDRDIVFQIPQRIEANKDIIIFNSEGVKRRDVIETHAPCRSSEGGEVSERVKEITPFRKVWQGIILIT
jgi:ATP-dependent exoDNAse (exonuclease V) alpha subunit